MSLVAGADVVFHLYIAGQWKGYMCARTSDTPVDTEFIETTAPGNGNWKTVKPTVHSHSKNIQGVISLNSAVNLTWPDLRLLQFAKTKLLCRTTWTAQDGTTYIEEAFFYIKNSIPTDSFDGVATFGISFQGTGAITPIFTPPTPITQGDMRYPEQGDTSPATTGAYTWSMPGLTPSNTKLTNVVKDGRGSNNIILSGTPVGNEVLFEEDSTSPGDGLLTWSVPFEDGETPPYVTYTQI